MRVSLTVLREKPDCGLLSFRHSPQPPEDSFMPQDVAAREPSLPPSVTKVVEAGKALGLSIAPRLMPSSTRTAQEAAAACGCAVAQIVKSLLFTGATSGRSYLLLVSGANRVDERAAMRLLGEALERPDANRVRETTGFAIGGVPPLGHATPSPVWLRRGSPRLRCRLGGRRPSERRLPGRSESPRARHRSDSREAELEPSTRVTSVRPRQAPSLESDERPHPGQMPWK